jgi:hypothetical protein
LPATPIAEGKATPIAEGKIVLDIDHGSSN